MSPQPAAADVVVVAVVVVGLEVVVVVLAVVVGVIVVVDVVEGVVDVEVLVVFVTIEDVESDVVVGTGGHWQLANGGSVGPLMQFAHVAVVSHEIKK